MKACGDTLSMTDPKPPTAEAWKHALGGKDKAIQLGHHFWKDDSRHLNSLDRVSVRLAEKGLYPSKIVIQWARITNRKAPITFSFSDMKTPVTMAQVCTMVDEVMEEYEEDMRRKKQRVSKNSQKSVGSPTGSTTTAEEKKGTNASPSTVDEKGAGNESTSSSVESSTMTMSNSKSSSSSGSGSSSESSSASAKGKPSGSHVGDL